MAAPGTNPVPRKHSKLQLVLREAAARKGRACKPTSDSESHPEWPSGHPLPPREPLQPQGPPGRRTPGGLPWGVNWAPRRAGSVRGEATGLPRTPEGHVLSRSLGVCGLS